MRLLWVSNRGDLGGAELALAEGVSALAAGGHAVYVVLPRPGPLIERLSAAASVEIFPHNPWGASRIRPVTAARWLAYDLLRAAPAIERHARRIGAEAVLSNTVLAVTGGLVARRAGLPHAWFLHEFGREDHDIKYFLGARAAFRVMRRLADGFIVNSEATRRYFSNRLPPERIARVRYSVEVADPGSPPPRGSDRLSLVLVGAKSPAKGQHEAIRAVGKLAEQDLDVDLELVGPPLGEYEGELVKLARDVGVAGRVRFVSFHDNPAPVLAAADAALMCSRAEAFGRVTIEAMKLGTPVVGANAGATPELIRHGWNGLLYRAGDIDDLAARLSELHRDRRALNEMGRRAREWALQTFTTEAYGAGLEDALRLAVAQHGVRA